MNTRLNYAVVKRLPKKRVWRRTRWQLQKNLYTPYGAVPACFETDGASVPFLLRWIYPSTGNYFEASVLHDYQITRISWREAADNFVQCMIYYGVPKYRAKILYSGVRLWGIFKP